MYACVWMRVCMCMCMPCACTRVCVVCVSERKMMRRNKKVELIQLAEQCIIEQDQQNHCVTSYITWTTHYSINSKTSRTNSDVTLVYYLTYCSYALPGATEEA